MNVSNYNNCVSGTTSNMSQNFLSSFPTNEIYKLVLTSTLMDVSKRALLAFDAALTALTNMLTFSGAHASEPAKKTFSQFDNFIKGLNISKLQLYKFQEIFFDKSVSSVVTKQRFSLLNSIQVEDAIKKAGFGHIESLMTVPQINDYIKELKIKDLEVEKVKDVFYYSPVSEKEKQRRVCLLSNEQLQALGEKLSFVFFQTILSGSCETETNEVCNLT